MKELVEVYEKVRNGAQRATATAEDGSRIVAEWVTTLHFWGKDWVSVIRVTIRPPKGVTAPRRIYEG